VGFFVVTATVVCQECATKRIVDIANFKSAADIAQALGNMKYRFKIDSRTLFSKIE
jgi:hypothetical protein